MLRGTLGALAVLLTIGGAGAAEKELHVVALYEGHGAPRDHSTPGTAAVTVDRPGKEVVLVVCANESVDWEVRATPKTKLVTILAVGSRRQVVIAPQGVRVEELTYDGKKAGESKTYIRGTYQLDTADFRPFVRKLFDRTEQEIASFQGAYRFDPKKPFVVDAVQNEERLASDFPKLPPAAQIPKLKVDATRLVFADRASPKTGYGEFTQTGPTADKFLVLPKGMRQVAFDKVAQHYGIDNHDLFTVDMKRGTSAKIVPPAGGVFSWPRSLTCDAKRGRVLVSANAGLFEYDTAGEGKWTQLTKDRVRWGALAWQQKTDTLFAFREERDAKRSEVFIPTLYELKPDGTVANKTTLGGPVFPGLVSEHGIDGSAELIDLGAELALLVHSENRDSGTGERGKPETFLYVIDPKTGKTKLAWKE